MNRLFYIQENIWQALKLKQAILENLPLLEMLSQVAECCVHALRQGNKILLAGNGGSAADAQHIAAELVGRYKLERPGLAALALTTDSSILTAIGNDYGYESIFERQVQAIGKAGDVLLGISTSGNSINILRAVKRAREMGLVTVGMTGNGGELRELCELCLCVPSDDTARIQECHIMLGHIVSGCIEGALLQSAL